MNACDAIAFHGTLARLGRRTLETVHGPFDAQLCENLHTREPMIALVRGDVGGAEPLLARVHSSCITSESFGGCDCDCAAQLTAALGALARARRGVLLYLSQEGRGAGFAAKARDRMRVQASRHQVTTFEAYAEMGLERDHRRYDEVASALRLVGIDAPLLLLTNNPDKKRALDAADVPIAGTAPLGCDASAFSRHYLAAKFAQGHALADPGPSDAGAELPEVVRNLRPAPVGGAARFLHVASYLLPIAAPASPAPVWLRLHAHLDLVTGAEPVVFTRGDDRDPAPLVRLQRCALLERFAPADGGRERRRWHAAVSAMASAGAGVALFLPAAPPWSEGVVDEEIPDALLPLLAQRLRGRRARLLLAADERPHEAALRDALTRHGIALDASVALAAA